MATPTITCICLGPPGASQPPINTDRLIATVYPKIFDYNS
jgi:hypothetical protein